MSASNPNYQRIWDTVLAIPPGCVASYGQVADLAGLPGRARLVGRALGTAPKAMAVPWYRVLRSSGQLAFEPGSKNAIRQSQRLHAEGVTVKNNRVRLADFGWKPDVAELVFSLKY
jgi:methylated-DNA-protein-cysteine methyltransferase-like protein